MYKIPISGGPHTGKSSLVEALRDVYPSAHFLPEPAEVIINNELHRQAQDPAYVPLLPSTDVHAFNQAVVRQYILQESALRDERSVAFLDRSLWDSVAHCRLAGAEHAVPGVKRLAKLADYALAFFCEPVGEYTQSRIRREVPSEAIKQHEAFRTEYSNSGLRVVTLPPVSVEERVAIVEKVLLESGALAYIVPPMAEHAAA